MTWQRELPTLPPEEDPKQHWWFYGTIGRGASIEYHIISVWRVGGPKAPWVMYGLRSSIVEPVNEEWSGWWCPVAIPDPPV